MRRLMCALVIGAVAGSGCAHVRDKQKDDTEKTETADENEKKVGHTEGTVEAKRKPRVKNRSDAYAPEERDDDEKSIEDKKAAEKDSDAGEETGWRRRVKEGLLSTRVHAAVIAAVKTGATAIDVEVDGNEVTLSGKVEDQKARKALLKSVRDVSGVTSVKDRLTIENDDERSDTGDENRVREK